MPIYWAMQHTLAQGRWLGKIRGRRRPFSLLLLGSLSARITNQVLLLLRKGYRPGAVGRVKQFEEFSLAKESNILLSVELLKLKNDVAF